MYFVLSTASRTNPPANSFAFQHVHQAHGCSLCRILALGPRQENPLAQLVDVVQPSFKLVYRDDDALEFRLTSNRNEMKDIVRPRLGTRR